MLSKPTALYLINCLRSGAVDEHAHHSSPRKVVREAEIAPGCVVTCTVSPSGLTRWKLNQQGTTFEQCVEAALRRSPRSPQSDNLPPGAEALQAASAALRDRLVELHPHLELEDASDEVLPWFALLSDDHIYCFTFQPKGLTLTNRHGHELLVLGYSDLSTETAVDCFQVLRGEPRQRLH